jgi:hypothetical protein
MQRVFMAWTAALSVAGCSPTLSIGGAYYPAWLVCIASGVLGAMIGRAVFIKAGWDVLLRPRALVYPALAGLVSLAVWFLFFRP